GAREPLTAMEAITAEFLREFRQVQADGPYYLVGACMGGVVAYEMAQQLCAAGQKIGLLALLETWPPRPGPRLRVHTPAVLGFVAGRLRLYVETLVRLRGRERIRYLHERLKRLRDVVVHHGVSSVARG